MKFMLSLINTFSVLTISDEHETLRASVIVSPKGTDLILTTNVPNVELDILVCYSFNIETN